MEPPTSFLGGLGTRDFLRRHWQKRPLLVRQAHPEFRSPISPDELAGLACEEEVESRLVLEQGASRPWLVRHGPFDQQTFTELPASHWTLLVQEANKYIPELALLLDDFGFIPHWRVDDLMVSYAPEQGSVGPHIDQYDVFLIQAHGRKRWQIDSRPREADGLLPDIDLRILQRFEAEQEWVLEPGDMLYLPPGLAHHGVALGPCMTFSVGFRAPSQVELMSGFMEWTLQRLDPKLRYSDPDLEPAAHPGAISGGALERIRETLRAGLDLGDTATEQWFAGYITEPQRGHPPAERETALEPALEPPEFEQRLRDEGEVWRSDYSRFAYIDHGDTETDPAAAAIRLYVDGRKYPLDGKLRAAIEALTDHRRLPYATLEPYLNEPTFLALLTRLYNQNQLFFDNEH